MLTGAEVLIDVGELSRALGGDRPPVVADARWNLSGPPGLAEFEAGHIPGAQWVDLEHELSAPRRATGGRHPLPPVHVFDQAMRRIGVRADTPVVVCDAANALAASRLWWLLTDAGHDDVRVLNGGVARWRSTGLSLAGGPAAAVVPGDFVARPGHRPRFDADEVAGSLDGPEAAVVVDVRAAERYTGETEPMDPVAGHIPGAINLPSMANVDATGAFLDPIELAARFANAGVDASSIIYCGSGVTAAHTLLALERAGVVGAAIYPGSWSDWVSDPRRPVATGGDP